MSSNEDEAQPPSFATPTNPSSFALANSGYLVIQALALLLTPGLLVMLLTPHTPRDPTDVEIHFARLLGVTSLLAAVTPLQATISWIHWTALLGYHAGVFVLSYVWWIRDEQGALLIGMLASGTLWIWGTMAWVFRGEGLRTSSSLFPPSEKRRMKVEKREKRFGRLEGKMS